MTGQIIQMPSDDHRDIQSLLPWFATGELEALERDRVQAHLDHCTECRAELESESRLARRVAELPADPGLPDATQGWTRLSRALDDEPARAGARQDARARRWSGPWLGWALAAQFCLLVVTCALLWRGPLPSYHALGAAPVPAAANIIVIFRPETPERELRNLLKSSGARLVGGPTASDAYLLRVAPAARAAVVARLRQESEIVLAEPIDGG
jgi:Putative zinc-finger